MIIKLAVQNIKGKKLRTYIAIFSVSICTAVILLFLSLSNGIQKASFSELEKKSPLNQITVIPKTENSSIFSLLGGSTNGFNKEALITIQEIDGVKNIYKESSLISKSAILFVMIFTSVILHLMLCVLIIFLENG